MRRILTLILCLIVMSAYADGGKDLRRAAKKGDGDKIQQLIASGVNVDATNSKGKTALHIAAQKGQVQAMKLLLQAGANIEARHKGGATPLHFAAKQGNTEAVQLLLAKGAKRDVVNDAGKKPIDMARKGGFHQIVDILNRGGSETTLAVLVDFMGQPLSVEKFSEYATRSLRGRGWQITKISDTVYQGDLRKSDLHYKVRIIFMENSVMIRYMPGYGILKPNYLMNLAVDFRSAAGL